jgi:DNA polymerase-3 subunit delta'
MPLASIIGHAPLVALLRKAVARERVPQTLLFAGPEGVGKRATALALAQAVNCPARRAGGGDDACGKCAVCLRIARGQHTDVTVLERGEDASIKLKNLRAAVLDVVGYRPFEGARRVFIIAADDLREDGQDALLKTLEEPTPSTILILVAAYPDSLSPTVQSRCRRLRFGYLSDQEVARVLVEHAGVDRREAAQMAAASGGSVSRALAERAGDLADDREAAFGLLVAARAGVAAQLKASAALSSHDSDRRDREALGARLDALATLLRDLGALAARARLANTDLEPELRKLMPSFPLPRIVAGYASLNEAQHALARNASPKIVADWVALHL